MRTRRQKSDGSNQMPRPDRCRACGVRRGLAFCNFLTPSLSRFKTLGFPTFFSPQDVVFSKGQLPRGVWVVCEGRVEITTFQRGKEPIVHEADPGDVLGLDEVISGRRMRSTAVALDRCRLRFIPRPDFQSFISHDINACLRVLHYL